MISMSKTAQCQTCLDRRDRRLRRKRHTESADVLRHPLILDKLAEHLWLRRTSAPVSDAHAVRALLEHRQVMLVA